MTTPYDAIVLAGGAARRLGGADKPGLTVGGRTLLDRVLACCAEARTTVVVGPERPTAAERATTVTPGPARPVSPRWTREQPPGGGPLAAVAAGLELATTAEVVLLLAADLPFLDLVTVRRLVAAVTGEVQAAVLVDDAGRDQPLAAAYRTAALRAALAPLGDPAGLPLRRLTAGLRTVRLADSEGASYDCDTWPELAEARRRELGRPGAGPADLTAPGTAG